MKYNGIIITKHCTKDLIKFIKLAFKIAKYRYIFFMYLFTYINNIVNYILWKSNY